MSTNFEGRCWFNVLEGAEYIGVHHRTLRNWIKEGRIKRHKLGRHNRCAVIIARSELDRFVERESQLVG